jgi:hypothetical protein
MERMTGPMPRYCGGSRARIRMQKSQEDVRPAHDERVDQPPVEAGDRPEQQADDHGDGHGGDADRQRGPGPVDDPAEDVAAQVVRAERVCHRRAQKPVRGGGLRVDGRRITHEPRHPKVRAQRRHDDEEQPEERHEGEPVAAQAPPGIAPQRAARFLALLLMDVRHVPDDGRRCRQAAVPIRQGMILDDRSLVAVVLRCHHHSSTPP